MPLLMRLGDGFVPAKTRGVRAAIEWRVATSEGVERLWMRVDDGTWVVTRERLEPSLTITLGLADLALLLEGGTSATSLFLTQRLRMTGDVLLAVRLPDFFGLTPRRERPDRRARRRKPGGRRGS
jgi:hypothetical protein